MASRAAPVPNKQNWELLREGVKGSVMAFIDVLYGEKVALSLD
jgi:hypothetical protein